MRALSHQSDPRGEILPRRDAKDLVPHLWTPEPIVALEKDDQMLETMIKNRNLPNPHLCEPFFCTRAYYHLSSMLIYRHRLFFKPI
jgi:hypothetical protein